MINIGTIGCGFVGGALKVGWSTIVQSVNCSSATLLKVTTMT